MTPTEYLEKIFQIPFVLPKLDDRGIGRLLDSFVEGSISAHGAKEVTPTTEPYTASSPAPPVEVGSLLDAPSAGRVRSGQLGLTVEEVEFLKELGPLVRTPRTLKRLANTYRLLRTTRDIGPPSSFLGLSGQPAEFRAVCELLAIAIAHPKLFGPLCWAPAVEIEDLCCQPLVERTPDQTWLDFVADLPPFMRSDESGWLNRVVGPIDDPAPWRVLHAALTSERLMRARQHQVLDPYQRWAPCVARFSFEISDLEPAIQGSLGGETP